MKEWLRLEALADYLKMSRPTVYKMAQTGEIPGVKLGRCWRFDREAIDQWLGGKKSSRQSSEFPWQDCLDLFLKKLRSEFGNRFSSVWIYGSWARGEARPDSDIDLLVVLDSLQPKDLKKIRSISYEVTFGRNRPYLFSTQVVDQPTFLSSMEPLLLNIREEGRRAA